MTRLFSLVLFWLLLARPALADGDASRLFAEGRELAKRGDHAAACQAFIESYALEPAVGTLLNLARCDEELGAPARAWVKYREVIQRSGSVPEARVLVYRSDAPSDPPAFALGDAALFHAERSEQRGWLQRAVIEWR